MEFIFDAIEWSFIAIAVLLVLSICLVLFVGLLLDDLCIGQTIEVVRVQRGHKDAGLTHDEIVVKYVPGRLLGLVRKTAQVYYRRVDDHWCSFICSEPQRVSGLRQRRLSRLWTKRVSSEGVQ